jgi:simple sugar transport system ATP-binding protein
VRPSAGTLTVTGKVAFVPEDRTVEGTIQEFTLTENLALVLGDEAPWVRKGWMDWAAAERRMDELVVEYDVRTSGRGARVGDPLNGGGGGRMASLSGGNQQKVVVAAALERKPAVLLAENPTRGLDIKASADVMHRVKDAARQGVAVLVHLPDLDELLPLVDRVVVLNNGVLVEMPVGADRQDVGRAMVSRLGEKSG